MNGTGEIVATGSSRAAKALSFKVPATAKNGSTRLRIQMHYGSSNTNPCATLNYGEVEDYTVNITGGSGFNAPGFTTIESGDHSKGMSVFPNPIEGSSATISYSLPKDGQVSLKVVDLLGRNVKSINLGKQTQGAHTYLINRNKEVSNGNYFIVLYQGNEVIGRNKVIILNR